MTRVIGRILDLAASATPDALAATHGERTMTFAMADRAANRLARALRAHGVARGDRIVVWCDASLDLFSLFFATQRLGVVFAPINPDFSFDEAVACIAYAKPRLVVAGWRHGEIAAAACGRVDVKLAIVGADGRLAPGFNLDKAAASTSDAPLSADVDEEDIHAMFFTSGSTGQPKGVMLSHRASWLRSYQGNSRSEISGGAGEVCTFPFFHWAGWNYLLCSWAHRRPLHAPTRLEGDALLGEVERWRASILYCIPAVWERVLASARRADVASLRYTFTGTSRIDPDLIARIRDRFPGAQCGVLYGSTEFGLGLGIADADIARKPGSVGLPPPGKEARIIDGELQLRSDSMMSGYFELPEQTRAVFDDGWYLTGDLADCDGDGYFTISGRRRDVIRSGGETIAPGEVEAALATFPGIAQVAVVGVPDHVWGEIICAAVVLTPGSGQPTLDGLRAHVGARLASFKHPRKLVVMNELPRTAATNQIMRARVRDSLLASNAAM